MNNQTIPDRFPVLADDGLVLRELTEADLPAWFARLSDAEAYFFRLDIVNPAAVLGGCFATARFVPLPGNLSASLQIFGDTEVLYLNGTNEPPNVRVRLNAKIIKQPRREIIASENFEAVVQATDTSMDAVIIAFDEALGKVLKRMVEWTITTANARAPRVRG